MLTLPCRPRGAIGRAPLVVEKAAEAADPSLFHPTYQCFKKHRWLIRARGFVCRGPEVRDECQASHGANEDTAAGAGSQQPSPRNVNPALLGPGPQCPRKAWEPRSAQRGIQQLSWAVRRRGQNERARLLLGMWRDSLPPGETEVKPKRVTATDPSLRFSAAAEGPSRKAPGHRCSVAICCPSWCARL